MRTLALTFALAITTLSGCSFPYEELKPHWRPLKYVVESPLAPEGYAVCLKDTVHVRDIEQWRKNRPEGPIRDAFLVHEQIHAERQLDMGFTSFAYLYAINASFMWQEEKVAYAAELRYLKKHRQYINIEHYAQKISNYKTIIGNHRMVSLNEARRFVASIVNEK